MQMYKLLRLAGALLLLGQTALADTLIFVPQPGLGGNLDYSWFTSGNWFTADLSGNLTPAGRLPLNTDTAIITVMADAGSSGLRVQTLIATNNAVLTNGTFAIENLQMLSGSSFANSTVNVLVTLTVGGTNCTLNGSTLTIFSTASGLFQPIPPANAATLNLAQGSILLDDGFLSLTDGSQIVSTAPPQSQLVISTGAALSATNNTLVLGSATNHLYLDNSGLIRATGGTLRFDGGIDWHAGGGAGEFNGANSNALLLFATAFHVDTAVTDTFSGSGTNRWPAGASVDGAAQVSGNLEILDSVTGAGNLEVLGSTPPGGTLTWSNGSMSLPTITVDSGGTMVFSGGVGSNRQLLGSTLNNSGLCELLTADLALVQGAVIFNSAPGTFKLQADGTFSGSPGPLGGAFDNAGTFLKTSSGITEFGTPAPAQGPDFNNTGLVDIQSGQLNLLGGISSGQFRTEPGAVLWFWGATHTLSQGTSFTGSGTVRLLEGIAPAVWLVNSGITLSNLEVGSNGTLDAAGNTSTNPIAVGALLADSNASLNNGTFLAQNFQMLDQAVLTNSTLTLSNSFTLSGTNCALLASTLSLLPSALGTLVPAQPATNCALTLNQGSVLQDAGILNLAGGAAIKGGGGVPQSRIVVSPGALVVSSNLTAVQGTSTNHLIIDNSGTIRADLGTLQFGSGLDWKSAAGSGEFKAAAPTALLTYAEPFHVDIGAKALFSGPGTNLWVGGGTLAGEAQISGNLQVAGPVTGSGTLHVLGGTTAGVLNWTAGPLSLSAINIDPNGQMLINAALTGGCQLSGCSIINSGTCLWVGPGSVSAGGGASINNLPGGILDLQTDVLLTSNAAPEAVINNGGLFTKSAGSGLSTLAAGFDNAGTVEIKLGTLAFAGAWSQTQGTTTIDAGATISGTTLSLSGGTLEGLGTINANIVNSGTVNPGNTPGTLTLGANENYQQLAGGSLALEIGGATPGTQYDELVVGGTAILAGRLELNFINGFAPKAGDQLQILSCASQSGTFSSVDPSPLPGTVWVPQYHGTNVTVILADTVSMLPPSLSKGTAILPFNTTPGLTYVVQATDSLNPPQWQTLSTLTGNGSVMSVSDSLNAAQRYYRVLVQ